MKFEVIEEFRDKHTKKIHKPGDIIEADEKRRREILEVGEFIKPFKDVEKTEKGK